MNIRIANKFDFPYFLEAVNKLHTTDHNRWSKDLMVDENHISSLYQSIIHGAGIVIIAEDIKPLGIIAGIISPFIWKKDTNILYEILFHTEDNPRVASNLIKAYNKAGNNLMEDKRIYRYTFTQSRPMFDIDMTKYNYDLVEKTWVVGE